MRSTAKYIIGVDEVGCGALAGDIFVCAFLAPKDWIMEGVKDSKVLSAKKRIKIAAELIYLSATNGFGYSVVSVHPNDKNAYKDYGTNLHAALKFLYWKSVNNILNSSKIVNYKIILDGIIKFPEYPKSLGYSLSLPKADANYQQVSAASIIAKVHRDNYMTQLSKNFDKYGWESNKGYPSKYHLDAINKFGICQEHRFDFDPIKRIIDVLSKA